MADIVLFFPPQWSPFQPALSLPSLAAWLRRVGFRVSCVDLNILFFHWLFSEEAAQILKCNVDQHVWSEQVKSAYRTIFSNAQDYRDDINRLKTLVSGEGDTNSEEWVRRHYLAVRAVDTYLASISDVLEDFRITSYEFTLTQGNLSALALEKLVSEPPELFLRFLSTAITEHISPKKPKLIGISCIGQDQLYFALLIGKLLKGRIDAPILVGGTILSRIFERGSLKADWFGRYFDIVVQNEGEKPAECVLSNIISGRPLIDGVPGIIYRQGNQLLSTLPAPPLRTNELPIPDFDDFPLDQYFAAEVTLPLLSARGCYWGKCEFCHHGMVYGEKYETYGIEQVLNTVRQLATKYCVRHFSFNDEAMPPKMMRAIGHAFPPHADTGWSFTGLIKFEKYFKADDFRNLYSIGFRSIYVGLESFSERTLGLMKKNTKAETIIENLRDARDAGIWMHCFLFFGFPGETEEDARLTFDFVVDNPNLVNSFGAATFSLEHNAPIFHHLDDFGLRLVANPKEDMEVFYNYELEAGIMPERALAWMHALNEATLRIPHYQAVGWVPREHLLSLLSNLVPDRLVELGLEIRAWGGIPPHAILHEFLSTSRSSVLLESGIFVNRVTRRVLETKGTAVTLFRFLIDNEVNLMMISKNAPHLLRYLTLREGTPDVCGDKMQSPESIVILKEESHHLATPG